MSRKAHSCFQTFDLALGRLVALFFGVVGAFFVYVAPVARDTYVPMLGGGIGFVGLLLSAATLYWRVTLVKLIELLAPSFSLNEKHLVQTLLKRYITPTHCPTDRQGVTLQVMRFLIPLFFLAGCTVSAPAPPTVRTSNDVAIEGGEVPTNEILIRRSAEGNIITQRLTRPVLFLEAREIGRCSPGEPVLIRVPDGTWSITALTPGGEVTRDVSVGGFERLALDCGVEGIRNPVPTLFVASTQGAAQR